MITKNYLKQNLLKNDKNENSVCSTQNINRNTQTNKKQVCKCLFFILFIVILSFLGVKYEY